MNVAFAKLEVPTSGAVVAGVFADNKLAPSAAKLDKQTKGAVSRAIAASRFKGRAEDALMINAPAGTKASRIMLVGLGKKGELNALGAQAHLADDEAHAKLDAGRQQRLEVADAAVLEAGIARGAATGVANGTTADD